MAILHVSTAVEVRVKGASAPAQRERCTGQDGVQDAHRADGADSGGCFGPFWAMQPTVSLPPGPTLSGHPAPPFRAVVDLKSFRSSLSDASFASLSATCQSVRGKGTSIARAGEAIRAAFAAADGARASLLDEQWKLFAEAMGVKGQAASVTTRLGALQAGRGTWKGRTASAAAKQRGTANAAALALKAAALTVWHSWLLAAKALWDERVVEFAANVDRVVIAAYDLADVEDETAILLSALSGWHVPLSLLRQFNAHEVLRQFVRAVQPTS